MGIRTAAIIRLIHMRNLRLQAPGSMTGVPIVVYRVRTLLEEVKLLVVERPVLKCLHLVQQLKNYYLPALSGKGYSQNLM